MSAILISLLAVVFTVPVFAEDAVEETTEPVAECPAPEKGEKPLLGCAQHLGAVTTGYERALEEWKAFARTASNRLKNVADKEIKTKGQIQDNSAEINKLKFKRSRKNKQMIKELERENKKLWKVLKGISKEQAALCKATSKEGAQKHSALAKRLSGLWKTARGSIR